MLEVLRRLAPFVRAEMEGILLRLTCRRHTSIAAAELGAAKLVDIRMAEPRI